MAKKYVSHLTKRDEDFAQWYTDLVLKTELADYAPVRGCMVIRPYGFSIWERIQSELDSRLKKTGHLNAYFPLLIPESLLNKEAEHVEGFAPEVAWVTRGGKEELAEPLFVRPTSEALFCHMYSKWVQSYRDLPMLYNQWCSVVRWEKTTRPFLRTAEFLWQEGHTAHATKEEAENEALSILDIYVNLATEILAIPVVCGPKTDKEKFAGALKTYTFEALMQDGKALQAGTSHFFGQRFAKAFDITFLNSEGKLDYVWQTSWGVTTRLIGAIIMVHGDDRGLALPPRVAPTQVVIVPIASHKEGVMETAHRVRDELSSLGLRVHLDDRTTHRPGWKFNEWELKGVPLRIELGPKDIAENQIVAVRRDDFSKASVAIDAVANEIPKLLNEVHRGLFKRAQERMETHTYVAINMHDLSSIAEKGGFVKAMWCGEQACEDGIKEATGATARCIPFEQETISDHCVFCGKPAKHMVYFARAY